MRSVPQLRALLGAGNPRQLPPADENEIPLFFINTHFHTAELGFSAATLEHLRNEEYDEKEKAMKETTTTYFDQIVDHIKRHSVVRVHDLRDLKAYHAGTYHGVFCPVSSKSSRIYLRTTTNFLIFLCRLVDREPLKVSENLRPLLPAFRDSPTTDSLHALLIGILKPFGNGSESHRHAAALFVKLNAKTSDGVWSVTKVSHTLVALIHSARLAVYEELKRVAPLYPSPQRDAVLQMTQFGYPFFRPQS